MDYLSTANRDILVTEDGSFTQRYVYDENSTRISAEYGYAAGTKRGEGGENLQSDFAANDVRKVWYRTSHLGSTLFAVDENGKVISHTIYDPWGNPLTETYTDTNFSGIDNSNNYTGYTWDEVLDLYFAQNRFYDSADHRFTQEDPIKDGENWYAYCGNNPVLYLDYLGFFYVKLRPLAETYGGKVTWEKATRWTSARAKVTINGVSKYYTAKNTDTDHAYIGSATSNTYNNGIGNTMYVDQDYFKSQWKIYDGGAVYGIITQNEMDAFENYKMAPAAYSYLMRLTYAYYLSNSTFERNNLLKEANKFRGTGYTNVYFDSLLCINKTQVKKDIAFMPKLPTTTLTQEQHYFRNRLNIEYDWDTFQKLNSVLPSKLAWSELPWDQSAFHKIGQVNNRKYVSADGHFEMVFTKENYLVNEKFSPTNMGTYNYYGPSNASLHAKYDVYTWGKWGNVE